jgi:hypothetical protein
MVSNVEEAPVATAAVGKVRILMFTCCWFLEMLRGMIRHCWSIGMRTGATVVSWEELQSGAVSADVLANSMSVGMVPNVEETPVATAAVGKVGGVVVFALFCCFFPAALASIQRVLILLTAL